MNENDESIPPLTEREYIATSNHFFTMALLSLLERATKQDRDRLVETAVHYANFMTPENSDLPKIAAEIIEGEKDCYQGYLDRCSADDETVIKTSLRAIHPILEMAKKNESN